MAMQLHNIRKPLGRSRVTNGHELLPGVDGRSLWARRARDLFALHLSDLGGTDNVSEAERSIVRRAAIMEVELERLEAKFATDGAGSTRDLDLYNRMAGGLRRLLETVGLQRRARDVTPTLGELLREDLNLQRQDMDQQRREPPRPRVRWKQEEPVLDQQIVDHQVVDQQQPEVLDQQEQDVLDQQRLSKSFDSLNGHGLNERGPGVAE